MRLALATFFRRYDVVVIVLIGLWYLFTMRSGHSWGDDFAQYILHARNIATLHPYADTGYIYNPHELSPIGPVTYPPVFPLLLAPVYAVFGLNLEAMKIECTLLFLIGLGCLSALLSRVLRRTDVALAIGLTGFNWYVWEFKNNILSDFPFFAFAFGTLFLIDRWVRDPQRRVQHALILVLLLYLSYATRAVGIVLPACLVLFDILEHKKLTRMSVIACCTFIVLWLIQSMFLQTESTYFRSFHLSDIAVNAQTYFVRIIYFWDNGYKTILIGRILRAALTIIITLYSLIGFFTRVRSKPGVLELFAILYVLLLLVSPIRELRYMLPLLPLYITYAIVGARETVRWYGKPTKLFAGFVLALTIISYGIRYTTLGYGPLTEGVNMPTTQELFTFVRSTPPKSVFISLKPRALALFTNHDSVMFHEEKNPLDLWRYWQSIGVTHMIVFRNEQVTKVDYRANDMIKMATDDPTHFESVFRNADFDVYLLHYPSLP